MRTHGKKYTAAREQVEDRPYTLDEALPLVQKIKFAQFDETVALVKCPCGLKKRPRTCLKTKA